MKIILGIVSTALMVSGCAPTIIGGGAVIGSAAVSEQGMTGSFSDTQISTHIRYKLFQHDPDLYYAIGVNVHNREVLLTGTANNETLHLDTVRLAWEVKGVTRVVDNITVAQTSDLKTFAQDSWITTRLNSTLLFDKDIRSVNYSVKTMDGVVYIMGIAQDETELKKVTKHASSTPGVKKVVSYAAVKDAPAEEIPPAEVVG